MRQTADLGAMVQKKGIDIDLNELVRLVKSIMESAKEAALLSDDRVWQAKVVGLADAVGKAAVLLIRSIAQSKHEDDDAPYLQGKPFFVFCFFLSAVQPSHVPHDRQEGVDECCPGVDFGFNAAFRRINYR